MTSRRLTRTSTRDAPTTGPVEVPHDKEFDFITKAFLLSGIVFLRPRTPWGISRFLVLCLDVTLSALCLYFMVVIVVSASKKSPHSAGHAFISAFSYLVALCIRFTVLWKRNRIRKCSEMILRLNKDMFLQQDGKSFRRFAWVSCSFAILFPLCMTTYGMMSGNFHGSVRKYYMMYLFVDKPPLNPPLWKTVLIFGLTTVNVLLCKCLPLLSMILCTFVFTRLRDVNRSFLAQLEASMLANLPQKLFADYTTLYGRITNTVEKVESAISLVSFFLYGYMLSCVFSVTSYMVSRPQDSRSLAGILLQAAMFVETVACFVFLSVRAASVNESAVEVKNLIHSLPAKRFVDFSPNLTATLLQLANNFASEVCVTGWGLFMINRGFILTTAGVVVTYGVILVQLGS